jgi:hypothetical protein
VRQLLLIKADGTRVAIPYKATPAAVQGQAVSRWFVKEGWRASEAAMYVSSMSPGKLRKLYQRLIMLGRVTQAEVKP